MSSRHTPVRQMPRDNEQLVHIPGGSIQLEGNLNVPDNAQGIVLFAHGSGSSRHSPRNRFVAEVLHRQGLATLLMDLLTSEEEQVDMRTRHLRFDINLLAERLGAATNWVLQQADIRTLRVGYFGASTGAAAALVAAADQADTIGAIVSRGGRPDMAGAKLAQVCMPTLLIVGERDEPVISLNKAALAQLRGEKQLEIIPQATHLFEEPGTLEQVARLAGGWFERHLTDQTRERGGGA